MIYIINTVSLLLVGILYNSTQCHHLTDLIDFYGFLKESYGYITEKLVNSIVHIKKRNQIIGIKTIYIE